MTDNYPKSTSVQSQKPQSKHQENAKERSVITSDLNDNQKRWLVVGLCLHSVISPVLRTCVGHYFDNIYKILCKDYNYLKKRTQYALENGLSDILDYDVDLNYRSVKHNSMKNNKIQNAVDLSKLFLQPFMAQYTGFNETCDSSALLGLLSHVGIKTERIWAAKVKDQIRNPWAHCNFATWSLVKYENSFHVMQKLIDVLLIEEKNQVKEQLKQWSSNGSNFLRGDLDSVKEIHKQTQQLAEYVKLTTQTDEKLLKIYENLESFEKTIQNRVDDLEKEMKRAFFETNQIAVIPSH